MLRKLAKGRNLNLVTRSYRFAVPVLVAGLIGLGAWLPRMDAAAAPKLPAISASKLLTKVASEHVSHLSGTVGWTANLGLPSLSSLTSGGGQTVSSGSGFDPTSLLSGTQHFNVWIGGANRQRISAQGSLQENDVVRDGNQVWLWNSSTSHVTHLVIRSQRPQTSGWTGYAPLTAQSSTPKGGMMAKHCPKGMAGSMVPSGAKRHTFSYHGPMAKDGSMAKAASMGTAGSAMSAASMAESLTPQAVASDVLAGLKASTTSVSVGSPVRVAGRSAYVLHLTPDRSVAANRASTVSSIDLAVDATTGLPLQVSVYATGQSSPALQFGYTAIDYSAPSASALSAPKGTTTSTKVVHLPGPGAVASHTHLRPAHRQPAGHQSNGPKVIGSDWGSIFSLSGGTHLFASGSGATSSELTTATTAVSGSWGSGRLFKSALVNALFLPNGRVLVGFATPSALEHAASGLAS